MRAAFKIFAICAFTALGATQHRGPESVKPIWTDQLLQREGPPNTSINVSPAYIDTALLFLDDDRLIVYEVEATGKLSSRVSPDISSAFQLDASVIDAGSGKLLFFKDWGTRPQDSSIEVTTGGVVVQTGDVLRILSPDFAEVRKLAFPNIPTRDNPEHCDQRTISVSSSRRTLMINCFNQKLNFNRFEVWDGKTFEPQYSWTESPPLYHFYSISDTGIAGTDFNQGYIITKRFGSNVWKAMHPPGEKTVHGKPDVFCGALPTFVSDTWLVDACSMGFSLVSTGGQVVPIDPGQETEMLTIYRNRKIAVSQNGQIAALSEDHIQIKKHFFTEDSLRRLSTHIVLYDLHTRKRILTLNITPLPTVSKYYDFALSPDGSKLGVLNGRNVSVYPVPIH